MSAGGGTPTQRDRERAEAIFGDKSQYIPGVGRVGPVVNRAAVDLLRDDPDEYFRLHRLWGEEQQ